MKRYALFTGSFDPFHKAHVWQLQRAYAKHEFDHAIVAPIIHNDRKRFLQPIEERQKLIALTIEEFQLPFKVSVFPIKNNGLKELQRLRDTRSDGDMLRVLGADSYIEFLDDEKSRPVLALFRSIVVERPAVRMAEVHDALRRAEENGIQVELPLTVEITQKDDVSAKDGRKNINDFYEKGLIAEAAYRYIKTHNLYEY